MSLSTMVMARLKQFCMFKNSHFQFEILDSNLEKPAAPILACYKAGEENVILFEPMSHSLVPTIVFTQ